MPMPLLTILVLLQLAVSTPQAPQPPAPPPYVVVMHSDNGGDWRTIHRDGWTRRERTTDRYGYVHMTGPAGRTYSVVADLEGAPISMEVGHGAQQTPERQRFDMTDTVLGEHCQVWSSAPQFEERVYGGPMLDCITEDGITLWTGRMPPHAEGLVIYSRAVEFERRAPDWSEFSLPHDTLNWAYWAPYFELPPETTTPAYEIRFGEHVLRMHGAFSHEVRRAGSFSIRASNARLSYFNREGGNAVSIHTGPEQPYPPHPLTGGSEPMDQPPLRLFGETCRWHRIDLNTRWGVVGTCVTDDGISLAQSTTFHHGVERDNEHSVATYFWRGAPAPARMLPPPTLFDPWIAELPN